MGLLGRIYNKTAIISTNMPKSRKRAIEVKEEEGAEAVQEGQEKGA